MKLIETDFKKTKIAKHRFLRSAQRSELARGRPTGTGLPSLRGRTPRVLTEAAMQRELPPQQVLREPRIQLMSRSEYNSPAKRFRSSFPCVFKRFRSQIGACLPSEEPHAEASVNVSAAETRSYERLRPPGVFRNGHINLRDVCE